MNAERKTNNLIHKQNVTAAAARHRSLSQTFKFCVPVPLKTIPHNILQCTSLSLFKEKLRPWLMIADFAYCG